MRRLALSLLVLITTALTVAPASAEPRPPVVCEALCINNGSAQSIQGSPTYDKR
jgi:hypothetical protein